MAELPYLMEDTAEQSAHSQISSSEKPRKQLLFGKNYDITILIEKGCFMSAAKEQIRLKDHLVLCEGTSRPGNPDEERRKRDRQGEKRRREGQAAD